MKSRALALCLLTAACGSMPEHAYRNPGSPDAMLSVSAEAVNISLAEANAMDELTQWMSREQPSRAALFCNEYEPACESARKALQQFDVPFQRKNDPRNIVSLQYERVQMSECKNTYLDNSSDNHFLHHPAFGCSIATNMVNHVSDKRQFVNPSLLDFHDGEKAAQVYRGYMEKSGDGAEKSGESSSILESK